MHVDRQGEGSRVMTEVVLNGLDAPTLAEQERAAGVPQRVPRGPRDRGARRGWFEHTRTRAVGVEGPDLRSERSLKFGSGSVARTTVRARRLGNWARGCLLGSYGDPVDANDAVAPPALSRGCAAVPVGGGLCGPSCRWPRGLRGCLRPGRARMRDRGRDRLFAADRRVRPPTRRRDALARVERRPVTERRGSSLSARPRRALSLARLTRASRPRLLIPGQLVRRPSC